MVKIKVPYKIYKIKELNLTTREYCKYHADSTELKQLLAKENNVSVDDIYFDGVGDKNIVEDELDFDNLDE